MSPQSIQITAERTVISMQALPADCWVCGEDATGRDCGIPVYEDMVLPNKWRGEWGGVPACRRCFERQSKLLQPMHQIEFLREVLLSD
jgi:hypothetical protein